MGPKLRQLKQINNKTRDSVFGYVRKIEERNKLSCSIPKMISYLCLQYYSHGEYFQKCEGNIKIINDKMAITRNVEYPGFSDSCSFGKMLIESNVNQIVRWTFKISLSTVDNKGDVWLDIGILYDKEKTYAFRDTGDTIYKYDGSDHVDGIDQIDYDAIKHNDEIILTLDTKKREIRYKKKNHYASFGIYCIAKRHDVRYKLGLCVASLHTVITLTNFVITDC